jgi:hypothetical protein
MPIDVLYSVTETSLAIDGDWLATDSYDWSDWMWCGIYRCNDPIDRNAGNNFRRLYIHHHRNGYARSKHQDVGGRHSERAIVCH